MEWSAKRRQRCNTENTEIGAQRAQRGEANSLQPTANSERQGQNKQTKTQHREHRGLSTKNTEKEVGSPQLRTTRMCRRERGGRHWEITEEKKKRPQGCPSYSGQAGAAKWVQYRAAGDLGYRGQKKRPDRIGAEFNTLINISQNKIPSRKIFHFSKVFNPLFSVRSGPQQILTHTPNSRSTPPSRPFTIGLHFFPGRWHRFSRPATMFV
jgi:hypothetical protein